jgi:ring-1,2-phenylacetyl-CoA epoxidase subunit PaaE
MAKVTVTLDGIETTFELNENGDSVLNAAIDAGVDAPFSCKGGVCTTCMAKVTEGAVKMDANYALTDKEVKQGLILCCQSHPTSDVLKVTWDL